MIGRLIKLKYCPRTKHSKGRFRLKRPTPRCFQLRRYCSRDSPTQMRCGCYPNVLRYCEANGIKVKLTMHFQCVLQGKKK